MLRKIVKITYIKLKVALKQNRMLYKSEHITIINCMCKKVQVGKDQEKAQSEKDSHSKNRGGKKPN